MRTEELLSEPERIGPYKVHPMASLFPLMEGEAFEDLVRDIEDVGQLTPIVVDGDVLMDGRNRLRACQQLGIPPIVTPYKPRERYDDPAAWILSMNLERRHLTAEQRITILAQADKLIAQLSHEARERRLAGGQQGKEHGKEGGRGHKKPLTPNSGQGVSSQNRHARSTAGRIATAAGVSRHKAEQALAVRDHAPELLEQVQRGTLPLREAYKTAREKKRTKSAAQPKHRARADKPFDLERPLRKAVASIERMRDDLPESFRSRFMHELVHTLEAL